MTDLTRRHFLTACGSALAASAISPKKADAHLRGRNNATEYDLSCGWIETELDGHPMRLRAYNGQVPGPTMEIRPGDLLHIRMRNLLTPYDSTGWTGDHNVPHRLDTTNLHLHGLEIIPHIFAPIGTSDPHAPMLAIHPGQTQDYLLQIPEDQPSGLFWYHPHHHGSTAVQAVSGMAGGIVVRGPIDEVPEIKAAREIFMTINDIGLFPSEDVDGLWTYEPRQNAIWNTVTSSVDIWDPKQQKMVPAPHLKGGFTTGDYKLRYFLINGEPFFKEEHNGAKTGPVPASCPSTYTQQQLPVGTQLSVPRYTLQPGEVVRFRMLNANSDDMMPIVVEGHEMHLIELDGVNFPAPRTLPVKPINGGYGDEQLLLAPANRGEFLIKAIRKPGVYKIVQLEQCQQFLYSESRVIAEIEISGPPKDMPLPTKLPIPTRHYPLIDPNEIVRKRQIVFSGRFPAQLNPIVGLDFMINNALYDEGAVQQVCKRGTAEEWILRVPNMSHGGTEGHPFHIHVNSFEVIAVDGVKQPPGTIQDTIWIQENSEVVIRMKFRQWLGKSVYHCHILPHEDTGMMQNFLIKK